jgi:hypothetical protein
VIDPFGQESPGAVTRPIPRSRPAPPRGGGPGGPRASPPTPRQSGLSQIKAASGLRSVARNNKATRLRTRPGRSTKSSAKDLSLRTVKLQSASREASLRETPHRRPAVVLGRSLFVSDCGTRVSSRARCRAPSPYHTTLPYHWHCCQSAASVPRLVPFIIGAGCPGTRG